MSESRNFAGYLLGYAGSARPAVIDRAEQVTHRELAGRVARAAGVLRANGIATGDAVALVGDNSIAWVVWYLAIIWAGATVVPLPSRESARFLRSAIGRLRPRLIVTQRKYGEGLAQVCDADTIAFMDDESRLPLTTAAPVEARPMAPTDLAAIMLTSGSSAEPKCVRISHRNLTSNTRSILGYLPLGADDRMMVILPLYYCFGASLLHTHLRAGGSVVLNNQFMFPDSVLRDITERQCTGFAGVPSTFQTLLRKTELGSKDLRSLRHVLQAGGRLPPNLVAELEQALAERTRVYVMYGATEATARLTFLPPALSAEKRGSIGVPIPGVRLELVDDDGHLVPDGAVGELIAYGDNIAEGYLHATPADAARFRDGGFVTGDLARRDADGFFFIEGRRSAFTKNHGFRVSPEEIEDVIQLRPEVVEVLVCGVVDTQGSESLAAYIVRRGGSELSREQVEAHCADHLPNHKIPNVIEFVPELPKNDAGKVLRRALEYRS